MKVSEVVLETSTLRGLAREREQEEEEDMKSKGQREFSSDTKTALLSLCLGSRHSGQADR